ncbi:uncharacterized protein LOC134099257 [Sardina pilchardus]|uniref:uncharacterized protein LOC134099257 n=1 Tax=Sardina pilchardus TaxID=27697 RepID=UPI002E0FF4DD
MDLFFVLWVLSTIVGDCNGLGIQPSKTESVLSEGSRVSLSCNYTGTVNKDSLLWYRQYPYSAPEFLYLFSESSFKQEAEPPVPGLSVELDSDQSRVSLHLSSAQPSDAALYYCALQPTVLGKPDTLYKKLSVARPMPSMTESVLSEGSLVSLSCTVTADTESLLWYRQYPYSGPEFLYIFNEANFKQEADPLVHGLSVELDSGSLADKITPFENVLYVSEETKVTLSCNYTGGASSELFWYRQYPGSKPEFIMYIIESGHNRSTVSARLSVHISKDVKRMDMKISSAEVSDSAVYYCALKPTVTGNTTIMYKKHLNF